MDWRSSFGRFLCDFLGLGLCPYVCCVCIGVIIFVDLVLVSNFSGKVFVSIMVSLLSLVLMGGNSSSDFR